MKDPEDPDVDAREGQAEDGSVKLLDECKRFPGPQTASLYKATLSRSSGGDGEEVVAREEPVDEAEVLDSLDKKAENNRSTTQSKTWANKKIKFYLQSEEEEHLGAEADSEAAVADREEQDEILLEELEKLETSLASK